MRTVLKYPGVKNRIADWIINYMLRHEVYLELFGGSAAVLLNKTRCHIETLNNIDGDVVNFFRVLRDYPEELCRVIDLTPFARDEYINAFEETADPIERASRLKGAQIENLPVAELLQRYNTADVFVYADPPYLPGIRKNYLYKYEMSYAAHEQMLVKLKVMISGYDNDLYNS